MIELVKIIGLQRSGTTYLEYLIEKNFEVNVPKADDTSICWKHAFPQEDRIHGPNPPIQNIVATPNLAIVLVKKAQESWIHSINRYPGDLYIRRPYLRTGDLIEFYESFYLEWEVLLKKIDVPNLVIDYEEFLIDFDGAMEKIKNLGLEPSFEKFENMTKVPNSRMFDEEQRAQYLKNYEK